MAKVKTSLCCLFNDNYSYVTFESIKLLIMKLTHLRFLFAFCLLALLATVSQVSNAQCGYTINGVSSDTYCGGDTGYVDITITGGTAPFAFSWSNGINTEDADYLVAG